MTYKISDDRVSEVLTPMEVAEQLVWCGAIELEPKEHIVSATLECGCDLEVTIQTLLDERVECFSEWDIKQAFSEADWVVWADDENGNDVLLCFGC